MNGVQHMLGALIDRVRQQGAASGFGDDPSGQKRMNARVARLGLTPRQMELDALWQWYCVKRYDGRKLDWNGDQIADEIETETISSQGFVPSGFQRAGGDIPIKYRKPSAPYALARVVVNRFTGLLFSEGKQPKIVVEGDAQTEDWINAALEYANIWALMNLSRQYGGAIGSMAMGFQYIDARPVIEVHDPRWCEPTFVSRGSFELKRFEKRYLFPVDEKDEETQEVGTEWYWYRRVIDQQTDTLWEPVPVQDGDEPVWDELPHESVRHGFGFVPVVWVQNKPIQDAPDGAPDCEGIFDAIETIDKLVAQSVKGTLANADPTPVVTTDSSLPSLRKGSDEAVKLNAGDSLTYLEMSGSGTKAAMDLAKEIRSLALEVVQCVLDHPESPSAVPKTATEIDRVYSSMLECAGTLRNQYGHVCLKQLAEKMIRAARILARGIVGPDGINRIQEIKLPPRIVKHEGENGQPETVESIPRQLGDGDSIVVVRWPPFFRPTLTDIQTMVAALGQALQNSLIDQDHAIEFAAKFFGIEDLGSLRAKIKAEKAQRDAEQAQQMASLMGGVR